MKIVRSQKYTYALQTILRFISLDSRIRALTFKKELDKHINTLDSMPYRCRKSHYFDSNKIRDLIVKGYTIVYKIDEDKQLITIIGIKNTQEGL